jgi:YVTN family beta-propeller protein
MIQFPLGPKGEPISKSPVLMGVFFTPVVIAVIAVIAQIPDVARILSAGRFVALGATIGLGLSIASLLIGAFFVRGPVAANAVKFMAMALMTVSLGILVGGCNTIMSSVSGVSGNLHGYVSGSNNATLVTVSPAATTVSTTQSLSVNISVDTLTSTGTAAASGSVVLTSGTYNSGPLTLCAATAPPCAAGSVSNVIPAGSLAAGTDTLTATFTPAANDTSDFGSTGTAMVAVTVPAKITPTVTAMPSSASVTTLQALSVTVTVSGGGANATPTGSVILTSGTYSSAPASALTNGSATISIPAGSLATGTDTLTVIYTPDANSSANYNSSSGTATVTVTLPPPTTPAVTAAPTPSTITTAQALSVAVTVTGTGATPTGTVQLTGGGYTSANIDLVSGAATISIPAGSLNEGADTLTVAYTPDANSAPIYDSTTGTCVVTVTASPLSTPAITITPTPSSITTSQALSVAVTVTGTGAIPTGNVQLTGGGYTSAATALNGGSATINIPAASLSVGPDTLTVTYTPDAASSSTYNSVSGTALVNVTSGGVTPVALDNPNGLIIDSNNRLYVANSGGNQVLVYTETLNGANIVTGLTQVATITANISSPTRLAFDALGYLYVTNLGNNTVTVYDTSLNPVPSGTISNGISRPLGVAVDQTGDVYVGNNNADNITVYSGNPNAGFTLSATLTQDNSANQFLAPGDITFAKVAGVNELFVGLGPGGGTDSVIVYPAPLRAGSDPATSLTDQNCPTGPNGPTGVATNASGSTIYITSFYNSSVAEYTFTGIETGNECPAPTETSGATSLVAKPEGVAIDSSGNIFVSNASTNTITVYNTINSSPVYFQQ